MQRIEFNWHCCHVFPTVADVAWIHHITSLNKNNISFCIISLDFAFRENHYVHKQKLQIEHQNLILQAQHTYVKTIYRATIVAQNKEDSVKPESVQIVFIYRIQLSRYRPYREFFNISLSVSWVCQLETTQNEIWINCRIWFLQMAVVAVRQGWADSSA